MTFDDTPPSDDYYVSTDEKLIDHRWLVSNLLGQSWTECWTHERMVQALAASLCFGVYKHDRPAKGEVPKIDEMVGFARVISDGATYSLLVDVVVDPEHRGKGLAKFLVGAVVNHPSVKNTVSLLRTKDAHALYEKFDYQVVAAMRRIPKN